MASGCQVMFMWTVSLFQLRSDPGTKALEPFWGPPFSGPETKRFELPAKDPLDWTLKLRIPFLAPLLQTSHGVDQMLNMGP